MLLRCTLRLKSSFNNFLGKSLISKEKAIQTAEKEESKLSPDPVFFMSLAGVNVRGLVEKHEYIFDIYTKEYDFLGCDVKVISAQDLWSFYQSKHPGANRKLIDVYTMVGFFVHQHPNGHFVVDECPLIGVDEYGKYNKIKSSQRPLNSL